MTTVNVYLNFAGNCEEAFTLYRKVFGGEFTYVGRYKEMPPQPGQPPLPKAMEEKIVHISLPVSKETVLMGSDTGEGWGPPYKQGNNFAISINVDSREEADRFYQELSKGGSVIMPIGETFWGAYYAMFTDRFGVGWMVSFALSPQMA